MPDIIINDKVKQAHFDEEEIIVGPNDDENLAVNNIVPTDGLSCTNDKVPTFCGKMQTMTDRCIMTIL